MSDAHKISIDELSKISKNLVDAFFKNHDFYSLLVLSIVTVTEYSRKVRHINTNNRINLAITFIPDLIQYLKAEDVISDEGAGELMHDYKLKQSELPAIMRSYIFAAGGLRTKMDPINPPKKSKWCLLQ